MKNMRIFGFTAIGLAFGLSVQSNVLFANEESMKVKQNIENLLKTNSCVSCDLENADFTRMELGKVNLENANLKNAKFQLADLNNCNLKNAKLEGANFGGADLSNCDLQGAIFSDKTLSGAYLAGVNYTTVDEPTEKPKKSKKVGVPIGILASSEAPHPVEMKKSKPVPVIKKVQIAERRDFEETPPNIVTVKAISKDEEKVGIDPVSKSVKSDDSPQISTKSVKPFQGVVIEKSSEEVTPVVQNNEKNIVKIELVEENIEPQKKEFKQEIKEVENEKYKTKTVSVQQDPGSKQVVKKTVVPAEEVSVDVEKFALLEKLKDKKECFKCDLSGLDLSGKKFSKVDLEGSDLRNCNLENTNFSNSNLKGVNFSGANLKGANFKKADLYKAVFKGADLTDAKLTHALVDDAQLTNAVGVQINSVMLDSGN